MQTYLEEIENKRKRRNEKTASDPLHWLNLAGLFWLEEGDNTFGSDESNQIVLNQFTNPFCGTFTLHDGEVSIQPKEGVEISFRGNPLKTDKDNETDLINFGSLTMKIIVRGGKFLVRIWDRESSAGKKFTGFHYYPTKPEYKITAKYVHYNPPKPITVIEMIGTEIQTELLGQAQFTLSGIACTLEVERSGNEALLNFTDGTNKETTYGGGRKFYLPIPDGDEIILDFNLTENWPCAYTAFAACPIPIKENHLSIRIEAGELKYHD